MTQLAVLKGEARARRRASVIIAVVIIGALVAAGGWFSGARLLASDDPIQPVRPPTVTDSPAKVVLRFLDGYGAHDADRALSYLTDEAIAGSWGTEAAFRRGVGWNEASGYRELIDPCLRQGTAGSPVTLRCEFAFHALRSDEIGLGPYGGNHWEFTVDDGRITSARTELAYESNGFSEQIWEPFADWVSTQYPKHADLMYTDASRSMQRNTSEAVLLWRQHTQEYVSHTLDSLRGSTAVARYIARAEAICAAAHDRVSDKGGTTFYDASWGRVLGEALVELRAVAPPEAARARFENAYALVAQLAAGMRSGQVSIDVLHRVESSGLGLQECTFHGPR